MNQLKQDYPIFNKFNFKQPPVGVKYIFTKPEKIERLDKKLDLCEMPREALKRGTPFYTDPDNYICNVGAHIVFGREISRVAESGQIGPALEIFKEPHANRRVYDILPQIEPGTVNYTVFSLLDKLPFDPDLVLVFTDDTNQAEVLLRAMSYTTGEMWSSQMTFVLSCAWIFAYPYLSGKVNYIAPDLCFSMNVKKTYPECRQLISIPYDRLPIILQNLQEMAWVPTVYTDKRDELVKQAFDKLGITPH